MKPNKMNHERKLSLMTSAEIQRDLDLIRLAYRERGSLNRQASRGEHRLLLVLVCATCWAGVFVAYLALKGGAA